MGVVWMLWPPETEFTTEDLGCTWLSLFRQRPGSAWKLGGRWNDGVKNVPKECLNPPDESGMKRAFQVPVGDHQSPCFRPAPISPSPRGGVLWASLLL